MSKQKLIIISTVLVDVIGFGIVIPILPFYVSEFGASAFVITLLFSVFSFFAFLSNPFLGALSDRLGRRPLLIVSLLITSVGWFVFAAARSIPLLFLGRIIGGAGAGNFSVAQSYMIDIAGNEKERTTNIGLVGATFGVGLMIGPLIGSVLSTVSHALPFWFAGAMALVNGTTAYFVLPESHHNRDADAPITLNPILPIARAFVEVSLRPLYAAWLLFGMAFFSSQSVFALYVKDVFGLDAFTTGLLFTVMGVIVALNQAVLLNALWTKYFSEPALTLGMAILLFAGVSVMALPFIPLFLGGLVLMATGQSILRVVLTSQVAARAHAMRKGEAIGNLASIMAASMVIAPMLAGALFEMSAHLPYVAAAGFMLASFILLKKYLKIGGRKKVETHDINMHIQGELQRPVDR